MGGMELLGGVFRRDKKTELYVWISNILDMLCIYHNKHIWDKNNPKMRAIPYLNINIITWLQHGYSFSYDTHLIS